MIWVVEFRRPRTGPRGARSTRAGHWNLPWFVAASYGAEEAQGELTGSVIGGLEADMKFKGIARQVSVQIHKINANVSAIVKLVDFLGSIKDNTDLRNKLCVAVTAFPVPSLNGYPRRHNLTDVTRELVKDSTAEVKELAKCTLSPDDVHSSPRSHASRTS